MKRSWTLGAGVLVVLAVGAAVYTVAMPRIRGASAAEIMAALPPSLKVEDAPDPAGEARYARLMKILAAIDRGPLRTYAPTAAAARAAGRSLPANEKVLAKVEALLEEGALRVPNRAGDALYKDAVPIKDAAKLASYAVEAAREQGDHAACARWASLGLRYGDAIVGAGGFAIDQLVAIATDAIAVRAAYIAEVEGGFDRKGRKQLLALLTPRDGRSDPMAAALRRDFRMYWLPLLLDPQAHRKELAESDDMDFTLDIPDEPRPEPQVIGTFDALATAKLVGPIYDAWIQDLQRTYPTAKHADRPIIDTAEKGLPTDPGATSGSTGFTASWDRFRYRMSMNTGRNTLGRKLATQGVLGELNSATTRGAANRNLLRAVILERMGQSAAIVDPFGKGNVKVDRKRKIVWSVGPNGKDDGGTIGKGGDSNAADLGYPFGDHSFRLPKPPTPPAGPPPGFPPGMPGGLPAPGMPPAP